MVTSMPLFHRPSLFQLKYPRNILFHIIEAKIQLVKGISKKQWREMTHVTPHLSCTSAKTPAQENTASAIPSLLRLNTLDLVDLPALMIARNHTECPELWNTWTKILLFRFTQNIRSGIPSKGIFTHRLSQHIGQVLLWSVKIKDYYKCFVFWDSIRHEIYKNLNQLNLNNCLYLEIIIIQSTDFSGLGI